ncbi:MAG: transcriptional regulator [Alphaproteobacteria bacterium]|nr:transcriptional regulator [Alphaproteobacteria bacterium]
MARRAQIIPPRPDLRRKAVNHSKGFDLKLSPAMVQKLEQVVHKARDTFTADIADRLVAMRKALREAGEGPEQERQALALIYSNSLDIKGAGGTIGYDLLTAIGKSLNDFAAGLTRLDRRRSDVIDLHIDALYVVLANRITGRGGPTEAAVLKAFSAVRTKFKDS